MIKSNWPGSRMFASNKGRSRRSTCIFFEEFSRLVEAAEYSTRRHDNI